MSVRWVFISLLFCFSLPVFANHGASEPTDGTVRSFVDVTPAKKVPLIQFQNGAGETINFDRFKGKVILLNIWATWCGPCIRELPALDRLQQRFADKDFAILPISTDKEGLGIIKPFYKRLKLKNLGIYNDATRAMAVTFPLDVVPANFIIDRNGMVVSFLRSYVEWDDPEVEDMINFYLQQKGPVAHGWKTPLPPRY
ncbi:MAG: TlpA family protein disulfide reductase [Candidatus Polarisedimenticolaceae bacterium]|nr:TlpA family protein disulfide reductase [Candidatus Polarisedimenticolaceae bacterium]